MMPQDRTRAILRSTLDAECRLVAVAIADHMDAHDTTFVSVPTIAVETALSERTVQSILAYGIQGGWLLREGKPGCSLTLRLVWERLNDTDRPARTSGGRKANPRTGRTGAPAAPVNGAHPTPAGGAPVPPRPVHPTPAPRAPEATTQATSEAIPQPYKPPPTTVVVRDVEVVEGEDTQLEEDEDPQAHRPRRSTGNLSTWTEGTTPPGSGVFTTDGREVPSTWPLLFQTLSRKSMGRQASDIVALCTKLRTLDITPAELLAQPEAEWRYVSGIGGTTGKWRRLAELCRLALWPPGCVAAAEEERPAPPPTKRRRRTDIEICDTLTPAEQKAWLANDCRRDEQDNPVLLLRSVGGAS